MIERNGSAGRLSTTQAGDVGLRIPKLRKGCFFPSILGAPQAVRPDRDVQGRGLACRCASLGRSCMRAGRTLGQPWAFAEHAGDR